MNKLLLLALLFSGCAPKHHPKPVTPERLLAQPCADGSVVCDQPFLLKQILLFEE